MLRLRLNPFLGLWPTRSIFQQRLAYMHKCISWVIVFGNVQLTLLYNGALSMNIVHPELSILFSITFLQCTRFWECTLVQLVWVGGWPFWWQLGLWVRGWESSMSTLWTDHFTPRIFVLLAFPSPSILAVSPPSTLGGSILHIFRKYLCSQFVFHSNHSWLFWLLEGHPDL